MAGNKRTQTTTSFQPESYVIAFIYIHVKKALLGTFSYGAISPNVGKSLYGCHLDVLLIVQILPRYVCVNAVHGNTEHFHDIAT